MRGNARRTTRLGAYAASGALALSGAVLAVTPAGAAPVQQPAGQAADWLTAQLDNGIVHNGQYDFDDIALTGDVALALDALPGNGGTVAEIMTAIEPRAEGEWYTNTYNNVTTTYAGSLAKLLVLVQETGGDGSDFGGNNLVNLLADQTSGTAPIAGRIEDDNNSYGDANVIGQAFAAHALTEANNAEAANATSFLLEQQCSSGYFRLALTTSKTAADQGCVDGTDAPDTDATAIALLQLQSQSTNTDVAAAIAKAKTWLLAQQRCDGSFGGGTSTEGSNANSTGLVAWALGDTPASRQGATWLRAHQATSADSGNELATQTGAIAYDNPGLAEGRANGITDANADQFRRATAQAAPGIAWYSSDPTPAIALTGPTGFAKAGTRAVLTTRGADQGTVLCLSGPGASARGIAGSTGYSAAVTLPAGTRTRVYTVKDPFGHVGAHAVKVLGKANLSVLRGKYKVKRSRTVTATVRYLAPGEWTRVFYKGRFVRSGKASATGTFSASFKVGRAKGRKTISATGLFTDIRRGTAVIKVVR